MAMDQSTLIEPILDHRNDLSDANSVDSYVLNILFINIIEIFY